MAADTIDILLLLALPASGKSEVRRYLRHQPAEVAARDFGLGPTVQLDDFPYLHFLKEIDAALESRGLARLYYPRPDEPMIDGRDWGTLTRLVAQDYEDLVANRVPAPDAAAQRLFDRIDAASEQAGAPARLGGLDDGLRAALASELAGAAAGLLQAKRDNQVPSLAGKTVVIEFARGGPDGAALPLEAPLGYGHSLSLMPDSVLSRARILYIWVTPEESRRKNSSRADPDDPGSILHHGVPLSVMLGDYGCDDIDWMIENTPVPGTVAVGGHDVPIARLDNRVDKTSFVRDEPADWPEDAVRTLHSAMAEAMARLR